MLTAPENVGPEPTVDKPSRLRQVLTSLGDGMTTYASIIGRDPGLRTHNFKAYMDYLQGQKDSKAAFDERKSQAENRSKTSKAEFILRGMDSAQAKTDAAKERKDLLDQTQALKREEDKQRAQEKADVLAAQENTQQAEFAFKERMAKADRIHDESIVRLRGQQEGGSKVAQEQLKSLSEAKAGVNKIANNLPKMIQGYTDQEGEHPALKPADINTMFRRSLAELNLGKEATDAAQAYFDKEVASQFQALAGGGASGSW